MKQSDLRSSLARVRGFKAKALTFTLRTLREAGHLTSTGARGVNAPDMTTRDLAAALTAMLTYETPGSNAAEAFRMIGGLTCRDPHPDAAGFSLEALRGLAAPFTFADALTALLDVYVHDAETEPYLAHATPMRDGSLHPPACFVMVSRIPELYAEIRMGRRQEPTASLYTFSGALPSIRDGIALDPTISPVCMRAAQVEEGTIKALADDFIQAGLEDAA